MEARIGYEPGGRDVSRIMRQVRSTGTTPELILRRELWARGLRYRVCVADLPGKPDIVFRGKRLTIFIDGDFWHGGQWRRRGLAALKEQFAENPNSGYWLTKIQRTMRRDCATTASLMVQGWMVLRFWESDIRANAAGCVQMTMEALGHRPPPTPLSALPTRTVAALVTGNGLLVGLERQGWSVSFAHQPDPSTGGLDDHHANCPVSCVGDVPAVALATASFPRAGEPVGGPGGIWSATQGEAVRGFMGALEALRPPRPPLVLLDYPPGVMASRGGEDFGDVLRALNRLGYGVDAFMLGAADPGGGGTTRLFVVGVLQVDLPAGRLRERRPLLASAVRPEALASYIGDHPDIEWRIRELPTPSDHYSAGEGAPVEASQDEAADASEWVAHYYLNPLVNELIRGRLLYAQDAGPSGVAGQRGN